MARSKNRKKKSKTPQQKKLKPENYIRKVGRKLPIHECWIADNWQESGISPVSISRKMSNGNIVTATYILDTFCLGVKNTSFIHDIHPSSYQEYIENMGDGMDINLIKIEPNLAFNIIYGAVEYAEDIGFQPHKDFIKVTEYLLDDVTTLEFVDIEFGKDGQPFYFSGPYDNVAQIMSTLKKNVGEGNFHYTAQIGEGFGDELVPSFEQEIIDRYFPIEAMQKKEQSLSGENRLLWDMQVTIAIEALAESEGSIKILDVYMEDEEMGFVQDITIEVFDKIKDIRNYDTPEEETLNFIERQVYWVLETIVETNGVKFLYDPEYKPIREEITPEEVQNLSDEEFEAFNEESDFYRTKEEQHKYMLAHIFLQITTETLGEADAKNLSEAEEQKLISAYLNHLKTSFERELTEEEIKMFIEAAQKPLEIVKQGLLPKKL